MSKPERVPESCGDPIRWAIDHGVSAEVMAETWGVTQSYVYILQKFQNMPRWKLAAKMARTFGWEIVGVMVLWASRVTPKREKAAKRKRAKGAR
jgi:DNA-binding XRE family transcriptional regulator